MTVFGPMPVLGGLLLVSSLVLLLMDLDGMSSRMPTQAPPRRFAARVAIAGAVLFALGAVGAVAPR